ncbi:MIEF1 upstream open reading frame protein-like isoform X3 [Bombyx mandarina]|uniref:MIEF1 upstream open reading frame protein-like isoform X3 n=1 Tax=Bombyx mandarina TaxID=7092 RepID=A0A6J2K900_BOMMA|nr:MIEF1 upstream open reading frame protein-like isoform X3 [Bombyx mandarina]
MNITRKEVLRLYRNLLMYSKSLKLTDPDYFRRSIKIEFKNNQNLTDLEKISFAYQKGQALLQRGSVV